MRGGIKLFFTAACRANVPMVGFVVFPNRACGVRGVCGTLVSASITGSVYVVVVYVRGFIRYFVAVGAFVPMIGGVACPFGCKTMAVFFSLGLFFAASGKRKCQTRRRNERQKDCK